MLWIIGDIHGTGQELVRLLDKIDRQDPHAEYIFVGDLFDRACHGHLVWRTLQDRNIPATLGNHERKMMQFLQGKRKDVPPHYFWALNNMYEHGITAKELLKFLESMPTLIHRRVETHLGERDVLIAHAGINVANPFLSHQSDNVYGDFGPEPRRNPHYWWDRYHGEPLVVYGHLSTEGGLPRWRSLWAKDDQMYLNSVGVDTAACRGGPLTAYSPEAAKVETIQSGVDYFAQLRDEMRKSYPPR